MEEEKRLMDETNENMEKDKIIDNGNIISWYKCHFNCSGELLLKKMRGKGRESFNRQNFRDVLN